MPLKLTITSYQRLSPGQETTKILDRGLISIGRASENDWVLEDPERILSKSHCTIHSQDGGYVLTDTSVNGTFLNDSEQRLPRDYPVPLANGDRFVLGEYEIAVAIRTAEETAIEPPRKRQSMSADLLFRIEVDNANTAEHTRQHLQVGARFVFVDRAEKRPGRLWRLLAKSQPKEGGDARQVFALATEPVALPGLRFHPRPLDAEPLGCLVTDRDLYRAEEDTVHLFVAMPTPPEQLKLVIEYAGDVFSECDLDPASIDSLREHGVHIEPLAMLLPGNYSAQLAVGDRRIGQKATFTIAEFALAPLSGRLTAHTLDAARGALSFSLDVESYQQPYGKPLLVELVENNQVLTSTTLEASAPGRYQGQLAVLGKGALRLRLRATDDAERVTEIVIPGSRRAERDTTVVNELGQEVLLSLMPEPQAIPLRGAYLSQGDTLTTPVTVAEVVADTGRIQVRTAIEALTTLTLDLASGTLRAVSHGNHPAGSEITLEVPSVACTVFVAGWIDDQPFEGFTHFFRPQRASLTVGAAHLPNQNRLRVTVELHDREKRQPVLLCVRDERLTATDTPEVALSASLKRAIGAVTAPYGENHAFINLRGPSVWTWLRQGCQYPLVLRPGLAGVQHIHPRPGFLAREIPRDDDEESERTVALSSMPLVVRDLAVPDNWWAESGAPPPAPLMAAVVAEAPLAPAIAGSLCETSEPPGEVAMESPAEEAPRQVFPEVLFYALVDVEGETVVDIPLDDALGTFTVEAFALTETDWMQVKETVRLDRPVRIDLHLPPAVHPADVVFGRLRAAAASGRLRAEVRCDGALVALVDAAGQSLPAGAEVASPFEARFALRPGMYRASVEDNTTSERDAVEVLVSAPGKMRSYVKEVGFLHPGEKIYLEQAGDDVLSFRVLPGLDEPFKTLTKATADYAHLCCEQTAAKILAATVMYLSADNAGDKDQAESIIIAGIEREKKMFRRGAGFLMYPDYGHRSDYYSEKAARYLWKLHQFDEMASLSAPLKKAVAAGLEMAGDAGRFHGVERLPTRIANPEDAYIFATLSRGDEAVAFVEGLVDLGGPEPRLKHPQDRVSNRVALSYAAATLLHVGDLPRGIKAANAVLKQLNAEGRLYSTVDSVACIALMIQLEKTGVVKGDARVTVNGRPMTAREAAALIAPLQSLVVEKGICAIELTAVRSDDWKTYESAFPIRVGFRGAADDKVHRFRSGDRAELYVELTDGYQVGDLVHVCLPPAMAWIKGGGKVQTFTVDFAGEDHVRIPVLVTGDIAGRQHFAVCVRNMFEEERASSPGLLSIDAAP